MVDMKICMCWQLNNEHITLLLSVSKIYFIVDIAGIVVPHT